MLIKLFVKWCSFKPNLKVTSQNVLYRYIYWWAGRVCWSNTSQTKLNMSFYMINIYNTFKSDHNLFISMIEKISYNWSIITVCFLLSRHISAAEIESHRIIRFIWYFIQIPLAAFSQISIAIHIFLLVTINESHKNCSKG